MCVCVCVEGRRELEYVNEIREFISMVFMKKKLYDKWAAMATKFTQRNGHFLHLL